MEMGNSEWAPRVRLQVGAAQGGWSLGKRNGCEPRVGGPLVRWLEGWAQWVGVGPRGWISGIRPQGDGNQGVAPKEGDGDTGVAPMELVPWGGRGGPRR